MRTSALIIFLSILYFPLQGQPIKIKSGNLDFADKIPSLYISFTYDNVAVSKYKTEQNYIEATRDEYNKKKAGSGNQWSKSWESDKSQFLHPAFSEAFIKGYKKTMPVSALASSDYHMLVHITYLEPGFKVAYSEKRAEMNVTVSFFPSSAPDDTLAVITFFRCPGKTAGNNNSDTRQRLIEAYQTCGKELGKFVRKNAY